MIELVLKKEGKIMEQVLGVQNIVDKLFRNVGLIPYKPIESDPDLHIKLFYTLPKPLEIEIDDD